MYLRRCFRRKDGKRHAYWALVESYRTNRGPRQRVVAWLGVMDERGRLAVKRCAEKQPGYQAGLFTRTEPEWVEVDVRRVRVAGSSEVLGSEKNYCAAWNWIASWKRRYRTDARRFPGRRWP